MARKLLNVQFLGYCPCSLQYNSRLHLLPIILTFTYGLELQMKDCEDFFVEHSVLLCLKCEIASSRFQPGKGPSRRDDLLRDCKIFTFEVLNLQSSSPCQQPSPASSSWFSDHSSCLITVESNFSNLLSALTWPQFDPRT